MLISLKYLVCFLKPISNLKPCEIKGETTLEGLFLCFFNDFFEREEIIGIN